MLVNMNEVLLPAKKNHYAVGLFNACLLYTSRQGEKRWHISPKKTVIIL